MVYEIINPSDPYTLVSEREDLACAAAFLFGSGAYGRESQDG